MEVKIKNNGKMVDATMEIIDGVIVVSPKVEKFEPKDGDVCKSTFCIYIFKRANNSKAVVYHCCLNVYQDELSVKQSIGVGYVDEYQRYATEEEKQKLFDKLAKEGYKWDAEKKELVKLKWKPKCEEEYFTPVFTHTDTFHAALCIWEDLPFDTNIYNKKWCFKTKEECQAFCDRLNDAINSVKL